MKLLNWRDKNPKNKNVCAVPSTNYENNLFAYICDSIHFLLRIVPTFHVAVLERERSVVLDISCMIESEKERERDVCILQKNQLSAIYGVVFHCVLMDE